MNIERKIGDDFSVGERVYVTEWVERLGRWARREYRVRVRDDDQRELELLSTTYGPKVAR